MRRAAGIQRERERERDLRRQPTSDTREIFELLDNRRESNRFDVYSTLQRIIIIWFSLSLSLVGQCRSSSPAPPRRERWGFRRSSCSPQQPTRNVIDARQKYVFFFCCSSHPTASKTRRSRKPGNFYRINFCRFKTTTTTIVSETTKKPSSSPGAPSLATKLATSSIFFSSYSLSRLSL